MKPSIPVTQAAEEILEKSGKPMHYKEITRRLLHQCNLHGKTPYQTVRSLIGTNSKFIRVAEGQYALTKWKKYIPTRFAKDIAFDILKSEGKPLSLLDLGIRVLEERKFVGGPKTVARNAIRHNSRFYLDESSELVYLVE